MTHRIKQSTFDPEAKTLSTTCIFCKRVVTIPCNKTQYRKFANYEDVIQGIFPKVDAGDREVFQSGICGVCWDDMIPEEEDE